MINFKFRHFILAVFGAFCLGVSHAQNVGINTTGATPDPSAILDLNTGNSGTMGFLAPQASLSSVTDVTTINSPAMGLIVYNTNASITSGNGVGYYYWSGSAWLYFYNTSGGVPWLLTGNSGTTPGTNFIGTTDAKDLVIKTNNTERAIFSGSLAGVSQMFLRAGSSQVPNKPMMQFQDPSGNDWMDISSDDPSDVFIGWQAGWSNNVGAGANSNVFIGWEAGYANTTAYNNTSVGWGAMYNTTTGNNNSAYGNAALASNTTGGQNTALGNWALFGSTGDNNTASGNAALEYDGTGSNNTATGTYSLQNNGVGSGNTADGYQTLTNNSGNYNTAVGYNTLTNNGANIGNTAIGSYTNGGAGSFNTGIGDSALYVNGIGSNNSALGHQAIVLSGVSNSTAIGYNAIAGESNAVILGNSSSKIGIGITTPSTLLQVGNGGVTGKLSIYTQDNGLGQLQIGNPTTNAEASIGFISGVNNFGPVATSSSGNRYIWVIGAGSYGIGGNNFSIANSGFGGPILTVTSTGSVGIGTTSISDMFDVNGTAGKPGGGSWVAYSDRRLKQNITPYSDGLEQILKINPVKYHYNELSGCDTKPEYVGVIAQDINPVAPYMVSTFTKAGREYYKVDNSAMTYMLINGVKEQQKEIDELKKENEELKRQLKDISDSLGKLLSKQK